MYGQYYMYILANTFNSVLYVGVTNDLSRRYFEHAESVNKNSFTAKYQTRKLVYYEIFGNIEYAIRREKQIKAGSRKKKIDLIKSTNPDWNNLFEQFE